MKQESVQGGGSPKRRCLPQTKEHKPKNKKEEKHRGHFPTTTQKSQKNPRQRPREVSNQIAPRASIPRQVVILQSEEASLYRIWEALVQ